MSTLPVHFSLLLSTIEPDKEKKDLAAQLPGEVREWLKNHEYVTKSPHTRLIGSYQRSTAVGDIKDIDMLVFLPEDALDRTPNSVLLELRETLEEYPDATAETSRQRRSIHLAFPVEEVHLDIVPAVAEEGAEKPLKVPDHHKKEWLLSDPLGYNRELSDLNQEHSEKVVPLIKLIKTWRNVQMVNRRPKSYVLEVMVFCAVKSGKVVVEDRSYAEIVTSFFQHIRDKYADLMDNGSGVPRIYDPRLGNEISQGWERSHFETFMRRIRDSAHWSEKAAAAEHDEKVELWSRIFGEFWPTEEQVEKEARSMAAKLQPGVAAVTSKGSVVSSASLGIRTRPTRFHGD